MHGAWRVVFRSSGGEWVDMGMSTQWNGEKSAFGFYTTLIFVSLRSDDIER